MKQAARKNIRTPGVKPEAPDARVAKVAAAVRELQKIGAAFSVEDVAERAGISRATIYRSNELRALIGVKGDNARPVDPKEHARLITRNENLRAKLRDLRSQIADTEQSWEAMRERALQAEERLRIAERHIETLTLHRPAPTTGHTSLDTVAAKLGTTAVRQARRQIARALHPDLFAKDPAAAALATELLKALNQLSE